ncbi:MAG: hypothetical protein LWY06_20485 [Firmicutes bacterium]|nr:hypothetical protein [Bacillota bacterium]
MKKFFCLLTAAIVMMVFASGMCLAAQDLDKNNPIDKAFAKDFEKASATAEINYVAEKYHDAWEAELKNAAAQAKKEYKFKEDKQRVDDLVAAYKKLGKIAFDLEMLKWGDTDQNPKDRSFGTGGPGAAVIAEADILKDATIKLIEHMTKGDGESTYKFIYKGKGAELDKIRNQ